LRIKIGRPSRLAALAALAALIAGTAAGPVQAADDAVAAAKAALAKAAAPARTWDGPASGPKAQPGKFVVYVSTDQQNGGALGVGNGVVEAAKAIGWRSQVIDGQGTVSGQAAAINQAIALKPDGIVLGGIDAVGQKTAVDRAVSLGIKVVGWHAGPKPGPFDDPKLFTNVETRAEDTATTTANYVIATSDGKANVVILTDSQYAIAVLKAKTMQKLVESCKTCSVLDYVDSPIAESSTRMPQVTVSLKQRFGPKLTWILAINDLYFDFAAPALRSAGVGPGGPPQFVSAGDGSVSAYNRIRTGAYQVATIPEPLNLHGWQIVDELNRAVAGQPPSGYVTAAHLVTKQNIGTDGGPQNIFDPDNGYRDKYKGIWGVK
jgi:ribose transport system substrate-binding protein